MTERASSPIRTRQGILHLLKQLGPTDAKTLAGRLQVSAMAVRLHLYELQREQLVGFAEERRPTGRPAKLWSLSPLAARFFPDGHADLAMGLLGAMREVLAGATLLKLLAARGRRQLAAYRKRVSASAPLAQRLASLARIRTEEGYMAEKKFLADGAFLLAQHHCPIQLAASSCSGLCASELEVFRKVLGPRVTVERIEHIPSGARRCAYRISKN